MMKKEKTIEYIIVNDDEEINQKIRDSINQAFLKGYPKTKFFNAVSIIWSQMEIK